MQGKRKRVLRGRRKKERVKKGESKHSIRCAYESSLHFKEIGSQTQII